MASTATHIPSGRPKRIWVVALILALAFPLQPYSVTAKGKGSDDFGKIDDRSRHRAEFYGIVNFMPGGYGSGTWVIGGRQVVVDERTSFDEYEGQLQIGSCAKVKLRNGRVHQIDSEPFHDCRKK